MNTIGGSQLYQLDIRELLQIYGVNPGAPAGAASKQLVGGALTSIPAAYGYLLASSTSQWL